MKSNFWLFFLISFLLVTSCVKEEERGQQIYFNSFESQTDTVGWEGNAFSFANDSPKHGGKKSLGISGGCVLPHAQYTVSPQNTDCYLIFKFWGKNLSNGGGVFLEINKAGYRGYSFDVSDSDWTLYESPDTLFCPANTSIMIGAIAGGISSSAILIDMVEIRKLDVSP
jgi:hypothetical protein